jgi:hypothetical protein
LLAEPIRTDGSVRLIARAASSHCTDQGISRCGAVNIDFIQAVDALQRPQ